MSAYIDEAEFSGEKPLQETNFYNNIVPVYTSSRSGKKSGTSAQQVGEKNTNLFFCGTCITLLLNRYY